MPINRKTINYIPPEVAEYVYPSNGKLLRDEELMWIKKYLQQDGRYRYITLLHHQVKLPFAIIVQHGHHFAVFHGRELMGKGAFARVKWAQNLTTGEWCALKIQKIHLDETRHKRELEYLTITESIVTTGAMQAPVALEHQSKKKSRLQQYLLLKLAKGKDLFIWADSVRVKPAAIWLDMFLKTLKTVQGLHLKNIMHRDLKPDHIYYDLETGKVELVDYGSADQMDEFGLSQHGGFYGTPGFIAPELMLHKNGIYDINAEVYALGETFIDMFEDENRTSKPGIENYFSNPLLANNLRDYFETMKATDPNSRPSIRDAINRITQYISELPVEEKTVQVGFLDMATYTHMCKTEPKAFFAKLKEYHFVYLLAVTQKDATPTIEQEQTWAEAKNRLVQQDVTVSRQIYYGDSLSELIHETRKEFIKQRPEFKGVYYQLSLLPDRTPSPLQTNSLLKATPKPIEKPTVRQYLSV